MHACSAFIIYINTNLARANQGFMERRFKFTKGGDPIVIFTRVV